LGVLVEKETKSAEQFYTCNHLIFTVANLEEPARVNAMVLQSQMAALLN
jgi:hypothetical protein